MKRKFSYSMKENEPPASGDWKTDPELYCHFNSWPVYWEHCPIWD